MTAPSDDGRLTLLTVHAHPDDEASKGAPTVARYHAEGVHTVLVCCTGGEEGDLQNPALREPGQPFHGLTPEEEKAKVVAMRPAELAASARIIGFDEVVMLGYRDSGMADTPPNEHPDSFHQADLDEATGRLVAIIRRTRPQVIITYGDDQRGYPHPDHLRVHDISVLAFDRAGDPDWYPELGEPFQPSKLYYSAWSRARMLADPRGAARSATASRRSTRSGSSGPTQDHRITTRIDVGDYQWARVGVAAGPRHPGRSRREAWWFGLDDAELAEVYPWEDWILARSLVGPIPDGDDRARPVRRRPRVRRSERRDDGASTGSSSARRTRRVDGPDDADVVVTVPLVDVAGRRLRPGGGLHAGQAEGGRATPARCSTCCESGEAGDAELSRARMRVPELAVADQHGADLGEQRRQRRVVGRPARGRRSSRRRRR